ncbi:hypothetical protein [Pseudomonas fluorescens]|uniref:hypothetical protein n=1 Tax=Pseudomonas fluorescens TaxID=294 RepID=UPI00177A9F4B|nr:hypothetical protein [Pseudomonas fluorescens]
MAEEILKSKRVNFLVADARVKLVSVSLIALAGVLEAFREAYGGLWVGGKLELTRSAVRLSANTLNRVVQDGTLDIELPLALIRKVSVEGGFITNIVRLDTDVGSVEFRCFGAKGIAREIVRVGRLQASISVL